MYDTREECPKTCENPSGNYDCGPKIKVEGCFCGDGFVEFNNQCVKVTDCGCNIPNENFLLEVGVVSPFSIIVYRTVLQR